MKLALLVLCLIFSGCAQVPISKTPIKDADMAFCQEMASGTGYDRIAVRTGIAAAKGAATGAAIKKIAVSQSISVLGTSAKSTTGLSIGSLILPFAVFGLIEGAIEVSDNRARIVRECLRDTGYKVY